MNMSKEMVRVPYRGTDEEHIRLVREAGFAIPTFKAHSRYHEEMGPEDTELRINAPNLIDGIGSIGLSRPLECVIDTNLPEVAPLTYDEKSRKAQLFLTTSPSELLIPENVTQVNTLFWLGGIVTSEAISTDSKTYSTRQENITSAKIAAYCSGGIGGSYLAAMAIPGQPASEVVAVTLLIGGGILGAFRFIHKDVRTQSNLIDDGLKNTHNIRRAEYMAVRFPVIEAISSEDPAV